MTRRVYQVVLQVALRRTMLAAMPDIPIGIFLAGCRECLGEWMRRRPHGRGPDLVDRFFGELQANRWSRPSSGRTRDPIALDRSVCPHGQTVEPDDDAQQ